MGIRIESCRVIFHRHLPPHHIYPPPPPRTLWILKAALASPDLLFSCGHGGHCGGVRLRQDHHRLRQR
ncbi:hypothetical protein BHE74_00049485 [Ensete ventricosum]|nr:hypothetical protein BHE74_00049485 [Ensete ventricosum]